MRKSKQAKYHKNDKRLRNTITLEAAKLMYHGEAAQFHTAKWRAARSIFCHGPGRQQARTIRPQDLPSNGEIAEAVYQIAKFYEGDTFYYRLFNMRIAALGLMESLHPFSPRLIGSVSTGKITRHSDIDIHVFSDSLESLSTHLKQQNWQFEEKQVCIMVNSKVKTFTHIYITHEFPVELSVYPQCDLRIRSRSSTDGKAIERLSYNKLLTLIETEHAEEWAEYLRSNSNKPID